MKYASSSVLVGAHVALSLAAASVVPATGEYNCSVCYNLTKAQEQALASYDNGGKKIICDPTCLDESGVTDLIHCNYFGLGQICRGCGDCTTCTACPPSTLGPTTTPITSPTSAPAPNPASVPDSTWIDAVTSTTSGLTTDDYDCSVCENLTSAQEQALVSYDNDRKNIVCDPTCLDNSSDPSHCNYFGLGQICRGCGNCSECMHCPSTTVVPTSTPSLYTAGSPTSLPLATSESVTTTTPVPATTDVGTPSKSDVSVEDCSACSNLTIAQKEELGSYDNGGKMIVCDPRCLDGVSDQTHCNYFGLGQICRGCGDCSGCTPCP